MTPEREAAVFRLREHGQQSSEVRYATMSVCARFGCRSSAEFARDFPEEFDIFFVGIVGLDEELPGSIR